MNKVLLPRLLDGPVRRDLAAALKSTEGERQLTIDFGAVEFAYPVGLLAAGREIRRTVQERRARRQITMAGGIDLSRPAHSFLNHVGFFDFIGLPHSKPIGAARGSGSYIPIRRFTRTDFGATAGADSQQVRQAIASRAEELAEVVVGGGREVPSYWTVAYSVREVVRNVFEHSGADECYVAAQRWSNGAVEMGVIDEGIGIKRSLAPAVSCATDLDALKEAVKPGVSRTMALPEDQNAHDNSGFGLYVLSELGRCFGQFTLASGAACLVAGGNDSTEVEAADLHGTVVGLKIVNMPHDFSGTLDDIVAVGEIDAAAHGRRARASSSSRSGSLEPPPER